MHNCISSFFKDRINDSISLAEGYSNRFVCVCVCVCVRVPCVCVCVCVFPRNLGECLVALLNCSTQCWKERDSF